MNQETKKDDLPASDAAFVHQVARWIQQTGEVLMVLRYLRSAGAKDYLFCRSPVQLQALMDGVAAGTDVIAFKHRQLPLRGVVTEAFVEKALLLIPEGQEYLIVKDDDNRAFQDMHSTGSEGDTHKDLREDLCDLLGSCVMMGIRPDYNASDHSEMISVSKGGINGPR